MVFFIRYFLLFFFVIFIRNADGIRGTMTGGVVGYAYDIASAVGEINIISHIVEAIDFAAVVFKQVINMIRLVILRLFR